MAIGISLQPEDSIDLVQFPEPRSRIERIVGLFNERTKASPNPAISMIQDLGRRFQLNLGDIAVFIPPVGVFQMPSFRLRP